MPGTEIFFFLIYCMPTISLVLRETKKQKKIGTFHLIGTAEEKGSYQRCWYNADVEVRSLNAN